MLFIITTKFIAQSSSRNPYLLHNSLGYKYPRGDKINRLGTKTVTKNFCRAWFPRNWKGPNNQSSEHMKNTRFSKAALSMHLAHSRPCQPCWSDQEMGTINTLSNLFKRLHCESRLQTFACQNYSCWMVSFPGSSWSHSQAPPGLIPRFFPNRAGNETESWRPGSRWLNIWGEGWNQGICTHLLQGTLLPPTPTSLLPTCSIIWNGAARTSRMSSSKSFRWLPAPSTALIITSLATSSPWLRNSFTWKQWIWHLERHTRVGTSMHTFTHKHIQVLVRDTKPLDHWSTR